MSAARTQCTSSTEEFPFFFDRIHQDIAGSIRSFVMDRLRPDEDELAREGPVGLEAERLRCRVMARRLAEAGLFGLCIPARYGGKLVRHPEAIDVRAVCLAREMLAWASGVADVVFAMQGLGSYPIVLAGTDAQREEFLPAVIDGRSLAAFAITETEAGSDAAAMTTRAVRDDNGYVIDGSKTFISNAGIAGHYVLFAKTKPDAGSRGISAFIIRPEDPGFHFDGPIETLAEHPLGTIRFDRMRVPLSRRLGGEGDGFRIAMGTLDVFRSTVGAAAIGMARRALDEALSRSVTRKQFGKPIAEFQSTQTYLAEMATEIDAARMLIYRAALAKDRGSERVTLEASMAKLYATEVAQRAVDRSLQLHGGLGVVRGTTVERLYREVRALRIYEGTSEIQRVVISSVLTNAERVRLSELPTGATGATDAARASKPDVAKPPSDAPAAEPELRREEDTKPRRITVSLKAVRLDDEKKK